MGDQHVSPELQQFIQREQMVAQTRELVSSLTKICWDKCQIYPGKVLSSKEEACLKNCALRYIDTAEYIKEKMTHRSDSL